MVLSLTDPMPGYIAFYAYDKGDGRSGAQIEGYLFSGDVPAYVERERRGSKAWRSPPRDDWPEPLIDSRRRLPASTGTKTSTTSAGSTPCSANPSRHSPTAGRR